VATRSEQDRPDVRKAAEVAALWAAWIAGGAKLQTGGVSLSSFEPWSQHPELANGRVQFHAEEALRVAGMTVTENTRSILLDAMWEPVWAAYEDRRKGAVSFDAVRRSLPAVPDAPPIGTPSVSLTALFEA
jgi:hypothetical protein